MSQGNCKPLDSRLRVAVVSFTKRPPKVSPTMVIPSDTVAQHAERLEVTLHWTPTCRACPGVKAALDADHMYV